MKTYQHYTVEDFLTDNWFLAWVKHNQPEARQFWEEWQQQNPQQRDTLLLAKDMAEALRNRPHALSVEQELLEVERIVKLTRHVASPSRWVVLKSSLHQYHWLAAALVALFVGAGWWFVASQKSGSSVAQLNQPFSPDNSSSERWVNQVNGTSQPVRLSLPDGSQMTLMPHSQASYPKAFDADKREIYLKGDALFSVVHEGKRPFLVYSGTLVTRVLGTQFRVQARPGDARMMVSVISGKVSVMDQKDWISFRKSLSVSKAGVVLTANQQVVYNASENSYQKELVPKPLLIPSSENSESFSFEDTPAPTVFERLKKAYGVEIIYDASALQHCTLTASLAGVSLFDQLQLLCASIGASYEVIDTRIIISSKGCS
ncbi:FecR family protein [Spirosoma foliorum]|uniref:FecR domain-containing protein n=1 Tax=Spirosoma foliorum TaxID=2710596 RepID=A0A7G5GW48_9BACT|nr:FecR family protein [Spirosoma foliorum]QMW03090.1 FecR domain-containing protein [Spirosoma foliorum]